MKLVDFFFILRLQNFVIHVLHANSKLCYTVNSSRFDNQTLHNLLIDSGQSSPARMCSVPFSTSLWALLSSEDVLSAPPRLPSGTPLQRGCAHLSSSTSSFPLGTPLQRESAQCPSSTSPFFLGSSLPRGCTQCPSSTSPFPLGSPLPLVCTQCPSSTLFKLIKVNISGVTFSQVWSQFL